MRHTGTEYRKDRGWLLAHPRLRTDRRSIKALGADIESDTYDTFNGLVFDALGTIPGDGAQAEVETDALVIKVTEIRDHQVSQQLYGSAASRTSNPARTIKQRAGAWYGVRPSAMPALFPTVLRNAPSAAALHG